MSTQGKLLSYGHKPVALRLDKKSYEDMVAGKVPVYSQNWTHLKCDIVWKKCAEGLVMSFEYTLDPSFTSNDYILFAYAHPFTKTDVDASIAAFE
jgi:hypothetical protein